MNCIVIDDEPLARRGMQLLIEQMPALKLLDTFSNAIEAGEFLKNNAVDLLFLDIQMPGLNGLDFLKSARLNAKVILTTAYPQFAVDAFELDVVDYLVKPIRFERFFKAIQKVELSEIPAAGRIEQEDDFIFIRSDRKYVRLLYSEMDYVEGLKDYVTIHCGAHKYLVAANVKKIHASLPEKLFLRVNKSVIVNASKIKSVDSEFVSIPGKQFALGDIFKKQVLDFIQQKKLMKGDF